MKKQVSMQKQKTGYRASAVRSLALWQLKRNLFLALIPAVVQFLFFTLPFLMQSRSMPPGQQTELYIGPMYLWSGFFYAVALLFVLLSVHRLFAFLHHSKEANFVFALPAKRQELFLALLLVEVVLLLLTRCLSFVQNMLVLVWLRSSTCWPLLQQELALFILLLAAASFLIYFYAVLANAFNAQLMAALFNLLWTLLILSLQAVISSMLPGAVSFAWDGLLPYLLAPYLTGFIPKMLTPPYVIFWLAFAVFFAVLGGYGFCRRAAEYMGYEDLRNKNYLFLKFVASFGASFSLALIFVMFKKSFDESLQRDYLVQIIGLITGAFIAAMLLDLIFSRGRVSFFRSLREALLTLVPALLILVFLTGGFFGWTTARPSEEETETLSLQWYEGDFDSFLRSFKPVAEGASALVIEDSAQIARIATLMSRTYNADNPGLQLPQSLLSLAQFQLYQAEQCEHYDLQSSELLLSWQDEAAPLTQRRKLQLLYSLQESMLQELVKDPGLRLLLLGRGSNLRVVNWEFEFVPTPADTQTCQLDHRTDSPWQITLRQVKYLPQNSAFLTYGEIAHALLQDYAVLGEKERLALEEEGSMELRLYVASWEGEEELQLRLPFHEDFHALKECLDTAYARYLASMRP